MGNQKNSAAQAATKNSAAQAAKTLASVLGSLPSPARSSAPVNPPKNAASECGKAWLLAAYAAKQAGKRPTGETLRNLATEHGLNKGNALQEAARYYRWCAQNGHTECGGVLPAEWGVSL